MMAAPWRRGFAERRNRMVEQQLAGRGLRDARMLAAMGEVPRHEFVPEAQQIRAYEDSALPIAAGQTISQPFIVAVMLEFARLGPGDRVLEIGLGSGYAAAVASRIAGRVFGIERHAELADAARERLARLGYDSVVVRTGDGTLGWPEQAPFDVILVSAGAPREIPQPLREQLAIGGRLIIPTGDEDSQRLERVTRRGENDYVRETLMDVRFVPLVGRHGWRASDDENAGLDPPS